jgi:hypothetical protein
MKTWAKQEVSNTMDKKCSDEKEDNNVTQHSVQHSNILLRCYAMSFFKKIAAKTASVIDVALFLKRIFHSIKNK